MVFMCAKAEAESTALRVLFPWPPLLMPGLPPMVLLSSTTAASAAAAAGGGGGGRGCGGGGDDLDSASDNSLDELD